MEEVETRMVAFATKYVLRVKKVKNTCQHKDILYISTKLYITYYYLDGGFINRSTNQFQC